MKNKDEFPNNRGKTKDYSDSNSLVANGAGVNCKSQNLFGKTLREIRTSKGITQFDAAKPLGLTQAQWSAYEKGKSNPSLDTVIKMANVLEEDPYILIETSLEKSKYFKSRFSEQQIHNVSPNSSAKKEKKQVLEVV